MSDLFKQNSIYQQLGFDSSNQWLLYDDNFQQFFQFFTENISDVNLLSENEVLEAESLMQNKEFLNETERQQELLHLEENWPGLRSYSKSDVEQLQQTIALNKQIEIEYADIVQGLCDNNKVTRYLLSLHERQSALLAEQGLYLDSCRNKAKELEILQRENTMLCAEVNSLFNKTQTPPLFMHQLPLEQYFLKCDTFLQYFKLYMKENFKILEQMEHNKSDADIQAITGQIEVLESSFDHYNTEYIREQSKTHATRALLSQLNVQKIHVLSISDMQRETHELEIHNEYHLKSAQDLLYNNLVIQQKRYSEQRIELILQENTKEKYERALKRCENVQCIAKILKDALSNAELIWIAHQLDMQKKRSRFDNAPQLNAEIHATRQRIKLMRQHQLQLPPHPQLHKFVCQWSQKLSAHLGRAISADLKTCFYEYEKLCRAMENTRQGLQLLKRCTWAHNKLNELNELQSNLEPFVYDSPIEKPVLKSVHFLMDIFKAKIMHQQIEKCLHELRIRFAENFADKMNKDKYFRYSRLLWVYFLTEPKRVLLAIEEVKKAAAKVPSISGFKTLSGIKRM